jgi:hypothetical protein
VVGREAELGRLQGWLQQALGGARQFVFVIGDAGVDQTMLVDLFLEQVATQAGCWRACGQCVEHYGAGEAYLPVSAHMLTCIAIGRCDEGLTTTSSHRGCSHVLYNASVAGYTLPGARYVNRLLTPGGVHGTSHLQTHWHAG